MGPGSSTTSSAAERAASGRPPVLLVFPPFVPNTDTHLGLPQLLGHLRDQGIAARGLDLNQIYLHNVTSDLPITDASRSDYHARVDPHRAIGELKRSGRLGDHYNPLQTISVRAAIDHACGPGADPLTERVRAVMEPILRLRLEQLRPSLVGFSVIYPEQVLYALLACRLVKEWDPGCVTVFGGPQVHKHRALFAGSGAMHPWLDYLVSGDGEVPLVRLLDALAAGEPVPDDVPNLMRRAAGGYALPPSRAELRPSEYAFPDYDDFPLQDLLSFRMTKGCVWGKCTFCTYPVLSETYFNADLERTLDMLAALQARYRPRQFLIVDDAVPAATLRHFARALLDRRMEVEWGVYVNFFPPLRDPELARLMRDSGCRLVKMGLESYSDRILEKMQKMQRQADVIPILESLKGAGLEIVLFILIGFPTETREEAAETLDFLLQRRDLYDRCFLHHFNLEEETPVFRDPEVFGIRNVSDDKDSGFRAGYTFEVTSGMTRQESARFVEEGNRRLAAEGLLL